MPRMEEVTLDVAIMLGFTKMAVALLGQGADATVAAPLAHRHRSDILHITDTILPFSSRRCIIQQNCMLENSLLFHKLGDRRKCERNANGTIVSSEVYVTKLRKK